MLESAPSPGADVHDCLWIAFHARHAQAVHAFEAFVNTMQGVNAAAIRKGFLDIGVKDNEVLVFSELMDAKSLFLTANADTVYFIGIIDLSKGPMVFEAPPNALGTFDDM